MILNNESEDAMNNKTRKFILPTIFLIIIVIVGITLIISNSSTNHFFVDNQTRINTESVTSFTVVNKQGDSSKYERNDEKFDVINNILSSAKVYHNKNDIYILDGISERIILTENHKTISFIPFYEKQPDGSTLLILKDFSESKSTNYMLDNHDYLVANISESEYQAIFMIKRWDYGNRN